MNTFNIIQEFFTRMTCQFCDHHFEPDGIELVREEAGVYVVSVYCHACNRQIGLAMVGVETADGMPHPAERFEDPELTEEELDRLSVFEPINEDDVLNAHTFFQQLGDDWMQLIPEEIRTRHTASDTESPSPQ